MRQLRKEVSGSNEGDVPGVGRDIAESGRDVPRRDLGVDGSDSRRRPLIPAEWGPVVAAAITAASSLLVYTVGVMSHLDARMDELEKEARVLLDGAGGIRPSEEAMRSFFAVEHLKERIKRLEQRSPLDP